MRKAIGIIVMLIGAVAGAWMLLQPEAEPRAEPIFPSRAEMWILTMQRFDLDGDLQLSHQEFDRYQTPSLHFEDFDVAGDGFISPEELDAQLMWREPRPLLDLKTAHDESTIIHPDQRLQQREGRLP
jgi:hypothetical protein